MLNMRDSLGENKNVAFQNYSPIPTVEVLELISYFTPHV